MKKSMIKYPVLALAASAIVVSCDNNNIPEAEPSNSSKNHVVFTAEAPASRTAFTEKEDDLYPVIWQDGDKVAIWGSQENGAHYDVAVVEDNGLSATFKNVYGVSDTRYYAVSPGVEGDMLYSFLHEYDYNSYPSIQKPTTNSCDPLAQILFADSGPVSATADKVKLQFTHLSSYGKLTLLNLPEDAGKIETVTLKAGKKWTGNVEIHFNETDNVLQAIASDEIVIDASDLVSGDPIWFGCYPVDLSESTLKITVNTENGDTFEKTVDMTESVKPLVFKAGIVSEFSIDMTDTKKEEVVGGANYFTAGEEYIECTHAIVKKTDDYRGKRTIISIGDNAEIDDPDDLNGYAWSIVIMDDEVSDMSNFSLTGFQVSVKTKKLYNENTWYYPDSDECTGTASITISGGNLTIKISDGHMPEFSYWGTEFPEFDFTVSYNGEYTEK